MTLSPPDVDDRIFPHMQGEPGRGGTAALSAVAHLAALALLLTVATQVPPAPPEAPAIPMVFTAPAPAPSLPTAAPMQTSVPLASVQLARPAPQAPPIAMAIAPLAAFHIARVRPAHDTATRAPAPAAPRQSPAPPSAAAGQAGPRAAPQSNDGQVLRIQIAQFAGSIHEAVQAAAMMPPAARRQHREGRAEVRFSYLDGAVAEVGLAQSSQSRLLDDAALSAVAHARYPAPPAPLRGHKLPMLLWIEFRMAASSADG